MADATRQLPAPVQGRSGPASPVPFGLGRDKPHDYREALAAIWANRDRLRSAWAVLRHGVCDGCSLSSRGLKDDTLPGVHLCRKRLRGLAHHTRGPLLPVDLLHVERVRRIEDLPGLGRLPTPFVRRNGQRGFQRVTWELGLRTAGEVLGHATGVTVGADATLETAWSAKCLAELVGVPCAAAGLSSWSSAREQLRPARFETLLEADLVLLWGGRAERDQPMLLAWLEAAKHRGTRVVALGAGPLQVWVPSSARSALFGSQLVDDLVPATDPDALVAAVLAQRPDVQLEVDLAAAGVRPAEVAWLSRMFERARHPVSVCQRVPARLSELHGGRGGVVVLDPSSNAPGLHGLGLREGEAGNVGVRASATGDHRLYLDVELRRDMLDDTALTVLLPLQGLYEASGTLTSSELRARYSPRVLEPMAESGPAWRVLQELAREHDKAGWDALPWDDERALRAAIGDAVPAFAGLERLDREDDWHWLLEA